MSDDAQTMQLTISSLPADADDASVIVERIANLLLEGYTSGYEPYWTFDAEPEERYLDYLMRKTDLSLFERAAYELLRERIEQDDDFEEEPPSPEANMLRLHEWLVGQAKSLAAIFSLHADHFQLEPFPWRQP